MQLVGSLYLLYFPYCGLILWEACGSGGGGSAGGGGSVVGAGAGITSVMYSSGSSSLMSTLGVGGGSNIVGQQAPRLQTSQSRLASLASLLLACSPPINGLLYGLKSRTLRRSVQNYWRKKATKSELEQVR